MRAERTAVLRKTIGQGNIKFGQLKVRKFNFRQRLGSCQTKLFFQGCTDKENEHKIMIIFLSISFKHLFWILSLKCF